MFTTLSKFVVENLKVTEERYLLYNFSVTEGMIEPHQTIMADLEVVVAQLGEHNDEVKLLLFGENDPNTVIYLHCDGQGPVVTVTPNQLDFGEVKLLESHSLQLRMVNDAPIPAEFCSYVELKNNYLITITPESGVIKPNSKLTLLVTLQLCDAGITTDNVSIKVQDSRSIVVHILAKGIGTSIVVEPAIYPVFDLGKLASLKHYVIPLKITNHSSKLHTLYWTRDPKCRSQIIQNENVNWKNFKFEPNKLDVLAQQTTSINLHIFSSVDREIAETFYNFAAISNRGSRFVLGTSTIKVAFISTGITVSEANLYFRIDVTPMVQKVVPKRDTVTIYNETDIDAVLLVWTSPPFFLLDHNGAETKEINLHFDKNSDTVITILFDPGSDQRCVSTVYNGILNILFRDSKDELPLTGEVNYPNISLSQEKIDFGYVPVGSGAVAIFTLLNTGVLPATYFWEVSGKWNKLNLPEYEESSCLCCSVRRTSIIPCNYVKGVHQIYSNNEKEIHNIVPFTNKNYVKKKLMICKDASIVRNKLYCLMEHCVSEIDEEKIETDFLQNLPLPEATDIDQVLDILPVAGILDGKSSQMVTVGFWPSPGTTYNLNACCHIVGGPKQFLTIDGGSSFIRFSVDKCLINFGCCTYCDEHVNSVTLKNLGEISIHFEIEVQEDIKKELLRVKRSSLEFSCSEFNTGLFFVEPCKGTLGPNDSVTFNVTYYPSVSLELDSSFSIQVNHLNPFIVKVKGYGVMPQVSINLPRSPMPRIPIRLMYFAIGQLTSSFFASKKSSNNIEEPSEEFKDWVFIGFQDDIPSISDIDLALERALVYVFTKDPSAFRHNYGLKAIIQGITVPEYILDFGYVVVETTVYQTVIIRNGGLCPLPSVHILLPLQKKVLNNKNDLNIEYKKVEKSEDIMIIATLFPRICNYDGRPQNLNVTVFVEVLFLFS
ncbi:hydrocephalus-inducing protein homolog [Lycorma delicatula]|uniref:hydrocephalus-inducing protein homolog n=1 Tax=Lycorma delicatula TaxID=130591 RepID=UPI003F5192E4